MRFFTPALYEMANSADEDVVDRADAMWEEACQRYRHHLKALWREMPEHLRKLSRQQLHDGEVHVASVPHGRTVTIRVRRERDIEALEYQLWGAVRMTAPISRYPFTGSTTHWLYDGIDAQEGDGGRFWQRVLFSDGSVMEIPFTDVAWRSEPSNVRELLSA